MAVGHRRLARIAGPPELAHIAARQRAFDRAAADAGLKVRTWTTGFSMEVVRSAVREIVTTGPRPTAVLFDDDLGAVLALGVAHEMGVAVPGGLSLLAWDDSSPGRSTYPQLSAMSHDVRGYGAHVARLLFATIEGAAPAVHLDATPRITPRGHHGAAGKRARATLSSCASSPGSASRRRWWPVPQCWALVPRRQQAAASVPLIGLGSTPP